jgi:hypothetical protein
MPRRCSLSRIETLIALLIAVLVAGVLVSVFTRVRAASNSQSCRMNLRQFGLAIHNCNDTNGELPMLTDQGSGAVTGHGLRSMFAALIPFLEATPYRFDPNDILRYNGHSSVALTYHHKDGTPFVDYGGMVNQAWKVFIDPSDNTAEELRDVPMTPPDGSTGYYATGSYAANGMLPWGTGGLTAKHFPRGLSESILFGERPQVCRSDGGEVVYNLWGLGYYSPHMPAFATLTPTKPPGMFSTEQFAPAIPLPDEGAADRNSLIRVRIGEIDAATQS